MLDLRIKSFLTKKSRVFLSYFLLHLFYFIILRFVFVLMFIGQISEGRTGELFKAFYLGTKFDLRLSALMSLPLAFFLLIPRLQLTQTRLLKKIVMLTSTVLLSSVIIIYFIDLGFFSYLGTRISATSIEVVQNPWIALKMAWETYPVIWAFLLIFFIGFVHYQILNRLLREGILYYGHFDWKIKFLSFIFCFLLFAGSLYGKFAHFPLRWSEAYFSTDSFISNFALNPVLNIIDTLKFKNKNFDKEKVQEHYSEVSEFLGVKNPNFKELNFRRDIKNLGNGVKNPPNIVIIVLESLAANKTSLFQNNLDPTPYLKKVANESVLFTRYFTPTEATARGIFATMTGIPDVSSAKTSSRNPLVVNQHTIINQFEGYDKYYFLGGSANWGNIRGIFSYNVDGIHIFEEGSYSSERIDVWGISDLDLFTEANKVLSEKAKRPFVALIQTAGFHRPYTIPEKSGAFQKKTHSLKELKKYSFHSNDEYNSLRFQDYSFGHFMNLAKNESYYNNTIFIVAGDHGLPAPQSVNMPKGLIDLRLTIHHTPLVVHAPFLLKPKVSNKIASQLDIFPTLAGLIGINYTNTTLGRDLFDESLDEQRYAFTYSWHERPRRIGLISDSFYYLESPSLKGLFDYTSNKELKDLSQEFPEEHQKMKNLCEGLYETARYMLFHNPKFKN